MRKWEREIRVMFSLMRESVFFAFSSLKNDRFRTFLSLSGVSVGIFSIVLVFCIVDALQEEVRRGMSAIGQEMFYVMEIPWEKEDNVPWWTYRTRPPVRKSEFDFVRKHCRPAAEVVYLSTFSQTFSYGRNVFGHGAVVAASAGFDRVSAGEIEQGRDISLGEYFSGANVALLGKTVAESLFEGECPVGKRVKVGGRPVTVVGVFGKTGENVAAVFDLDHSLVIPLEYGRKFVDISRRSGMMMVLPSAGGGDVLESELRRLMRSCRQLSPEEEDDFAVNRMTFLAESVDRVMNAVSTVGWVIGAFSLLIGGFGIANIMFVSVKERTSQIGLQKALGAKRYFILTQFLVESAALSLAGGLLGIFLVLLVVRAGGENPGVPFVLGWDDALKGLVIAMAIGLVSGIWPARSAAGLDPARAVD